MASVVAWLGSRATGSLLKVAKTEGRAAVEVVEMTVARAAKAVVAKAAEGTADGRCASSLRIESCDPSCSTR